MADRRSLRDKAKSAGESVAGTLSKGAKRLKQQVTQSDADGLTLSYNNETGRFILFDARGEIIDQFDTKREAAARVREIKRRRNESEVSGDNSGNFATGFSQKVNETVKGAMGGTNDDEEGRFQQFATNFAESVNETVATAGRGNQQRGRGKLVTVEYEGAGNRSQGGWVVSGPDGTFGVYETKQVAVEQAKNIYRNNNEYVGVNVYKKTGEFQDARSVADSGRQTRNQNGGGPTVPGFGMGRQEESESGPTIPGVGMGGGEPTLPAAMGAQDGEDDMGEPMIPGFGSPDTDESDDDKPPWMW